MADTPIFNKHSLRSAIAATWGNHGAHVEVYDHLQTRHSQLMNDVAARDEVLKDLALYIGQYEWKQLTCEQRDLLSKITGYTDPIGPCSDHSPNDTTTSAAIHG